MSHVPHELAEEFPNKIEQMRVLKLENAHFAKLADQYHELNREIHRIEVDVEPTSDSRVVELRKKRMMLKDEISTML